ncbi:phage scaffolding protein (plasmid) [Staphylococcus aureus]|uniref:phage scaffolding protein n=1 Tax=Staphylococcus aureus TaxID=1280 RepID=UPI0021D3B6B3|nr:phage scaffolding protein [Staphylococcus aureus]UXV54401.1 phage scaffolding protein [Staphylococcus aureus]UXV57113.1 phage scaffolding protein [Staphylococcus aureus]
MDIKNLLTQLQNGEIEIDKAIEQLNELKKDMVPRSRLNEKIAEIDSLNAEITKRDSQIDELSKSNEKDDELKIQLEQLQKDNEAWATKYKESKLDNAIKLAVAKEANDANDILSFINRDNLEITEDGAIKGLDDAITQIKEAKPYLFQPVKPTGKRPQDGETQVVTREQFANMTYSQRVDLQAKQPDLYAQLTK